MDQPRFVNGFRSQPLSGGAAEFLAVPPLDRRARTRERHDERTHQQARRLHDRPMVDATSHAVEVYPPDIVKRRTVTSGGMAHELVRLNAGAPRIEAPVRGGLAAWQQRTVTTYVEEHLAEQVSLATLAQLVRVSPCHFCRAFKQSLGMPPHRYHSSGRIERAKILLAKPASSVTDIGLTVGFSETSSFTAALR